MLFFSQIFCEIAFSVTSCTENEATRYGRFLSVMLETVMRWHANPSAFENECVGYPGFVTKFRISNQVNQMKFIRNKLPIRLYIIKNVMKIEIF